MFSKTANVYSLHVELVSHGKIVIDKIAYNRLSLRIGDVRNDPVIHFKLEPVEFVVEIYQLSLILGGRQVKLGNFFYGLRVAEIGDFALDDQVEDLVDLFLKKRVFCSQVVDFGVQSLVKRKKLAKLAIVVLEVDFKCKVAISAPCAPDGVGGTTVVAAFLAVFFVLF